MTRIMSSVTVQSENDWKLKSGLHSLAYELRNPQSGSALENGSVVASLTKDESHKQQEYDCNILDKPNYTGDYTDHLTLAHCISGYSVQHYI